MLGTKEREATDVTPACRMWHSLLWGHETAQMLVSVVMQAVPR